MAAARRTGHHSRKGSCNAPYVTDARRAGLMAKGRLPGVKIQRAERQKREVTIPDCPGQMPAQLSPRCGLLNGTHLLRVRVRRKLQRYGNKGPGKPARGPRVFKQQPRQSVQPSRPFSLVNGRHDMSVRSTFKHRHLIDVINKLEMEDRDRERLHGLVSCAEEFKMKKENKNCKCIGIESLGHGSWNCAYRLIFDNKETLAALVSNYEPKAFSKTMKESEIATMQYLHNNRKYSDHFKVPEVYDWDLSHDNKAGAPYILREVIEGKDLSREFDSLTEAQKLQVTRAIARVHRILSQPADFKSIGGIYMSQKGSERRFTTGRYPSNWSGNGAYETIGSLWEEKLKQGPMKNNQSRLDKLIGNFLPPGRLSTLCIQHFDLAIRNVVFDDNFEIAGVIDWEYAQVVPLAVAAKVPLDFVNNPVLSEAYIAAYADPEMGTSSQDFEDSIDYIHFHDLIMGPDHAISKKYVSAWIDGLDAYFSERQCREAARNGNAILKFPKQLRELRRLEGEGPELAGNSCS